MNTAWTFAEKLWHQHFAALQDAGYQLERTDEEHYWEMHEAELRAHFPLEAMISLGQLSTEKARAGQKRMAAARGDTPLSDFCIVRKNGELAAMFCGIQKSSDTYRMWHTHVHPNYRRCGIYHRIVTSTIAYTQALGFDRITSEHAPSNNPILIAKLRVGFHITALEIDASVGTSIVLHYFHNPDQLAAYEFRCGLATINPRILDAGHGAMDALTHQFHPPSE